MAKLARENAELVEKQQRERKERAADFALRVQQETAELCRRAVRHATFDSKKHMSLRDGCAEAITEMFALQRDPLA